VDYWFLLSYPGSFGQHALQDSDLPSEVKGHLDALVEEITYARVLLLQRPRARQREAVDCFWVEARERGAFYLRLPLENYDQIRDLDWHALAGADAQSMAGVERTPFYLVCTNGKRDPCCAQFGIPVLNALQGLEPEGVWACSHVGGHRFAANVLLFPSGLYYGRVNPSQCAGLIEATQKGQILMRHYRGRSCYDRPVQAAERELRLMTGRAEMEALRLVSSTQLEEQRWRVRFEDTLLGEQYELWVNLHRGQRLDYVSCNSKKRAPVLSYGVRLRGEGRGG
jgi:hypothetical protein